MNSSTLSENRNFNFEKLKLMNMNVRIRKDSSILCLLKVKIPNKL